MIKFLLRLVINAGALVLIASIVPGINIISFWTALLVAVILGFCNAIIRPILIFFTLPITILTLGLFIFVINASIFLFVASFVEGFEVGGFLSAILGSILMSVVSSITHKLL